MKLTVLLLLCICCCSFSFGDVDLVVKTQDGLVQGTLSPSGTHKVWYIPYAAPPTGINRWTSPQPVTPWSSVRDCSQVPPICPQVGIMTNFFPTSEDCLYLSVYVPVNHTTSDDPLAVQIFIHGGSYQTGGLALYNGEILSGDDVIFVAINYRLGALGYLCHPALYTSPGRGNGAGWYGIQDQRYAMQWVQDNIQAFGGNSNKVTISGESAGAVSVVIHLASSLAEGLFHQGIMESGPFEMETNATAIPSSEQFATSVGCTDSNSIISCMLDTPADTLVNVPIYLQAALGCSQEMVMQPLDIISNGGGARVPLLFGTNRNESALFICPNPSLNNMTYDQFDNYVFNTYNATVAKQVLQLYPEDQFPLGATSQYTSMLTDIYYKCPNRQLGMLLGETPSSSPTFVYMVTHPPDFMQILKISEGLWGVSNPSCLGVAHSFELAYIFNLFEMVLNTSLLTPDELVLRMNMRNAWASFVTSGVPQLPSGLGSWPLFSAQSEAYVTIDLSFSFANGYRSAQCDFWENIPN